MILKRREIPIILAAFSGLVIMIAYYFPVPKDVTSTVNELNNMSSILSVWALTIGGVSILLHYGREVARHQKEWWLRALTIFLIILVPIMGIANISLNWFVMWVEFPIHLTIAGLAVVFWMTATFRTFRIRNWEGVAIMAGALLVLLYYTPLFSGIVTPWLNPIGNWAYNIGYTGVYRTMVITGGIAVIVTAARTWLGIERAVLSEGSAGGS
jgi:hypothetical protein